MTSIVTLRKINLFYDGVVEFGLLGLCSFPTLQPYKNKKTTASNVPIVAPNVITSLSLTGNRDWVLCIEYEVFI